MAIAGDVPLGAGLSSSASLEAAVAFFLLQSGPRSRADSGILRRERRCRPGPDGARPDPAGGPRTRSWGWPPGLLDQFSSLFGREHHALYLDCQTLEHARLPLGDPGPAIIVCDSKTSRRLADGMYNRRRAECETVVAYFPGPRRPDRVTSLRDVSLEELTGALGQARSRSAACGPGTCSPRTSGSAAGPQALRSGDLAEFGRLISASHASSRDDFENSSEALNALVEAAAESAPGFLGGKLSGAGWAGCTVNLVRAEQAEAFAEAVRTGYARRGESPRISTSAMPPTGHSGGPSSNPAEFRTGRRFRLAPTRGRPS